MVNDFNVFIQEYTKNRTVSNHEFVDLNTLTSFQNEKKIRDNIKQYSSQNKTTQTYFGRETLDVKKFVLQTGFMKSILTILKSSISNLISGRELVLISNNEDLNLETINEEISDLGLLNFILENLDEFLYWGTCICIIHNNTLRKLPPASSLQNVTLTLYDKEIMKTVDEELINKVNINFFDGSTSELRYDKCFLLQYEPDLIEWGVDEETGIIVKEVLQGKSLFAGNLWDIFILYAKRKMSTMFSFKEVLKPDIMISNFTDGVKNEDREMTVQKIERVLNDHESSQILNGNPVQVMSMLELKALEQFRVLPNIQGVSSTDKFQNDTLRERKQILDEDKEKEKLEILQNLQIPEELFNGNGNQYEIESRSSNYKNMISLILTSIENNIVRWIKNKYPNISFGKLTTSINPSYLGLFNNSNTTMGEMIENLSKVAEFQEKVSDIVNADGYQKDKLKIIIKDLVGKLDPSLLGVIESLEENNNEDGVENAE